MSAPFVYLLLQVALVAVPGQCDYSVTIYPEYLSQNGRSHFDTDRWDNHNGLDWPMFIPKNKIIGSEAGRWMNRDLNGGVYKNTPEDPHRKGYPDRNHFHNAGLLKMLTELYMENINGYGKDLDMVMNIGGRTWPHWMDTSHHGGTFPNNVDAGAELTTLMVTAINNHTRGIHPPYFEALGEPDSQWRHVSWETTIEFHRILAQKLKAKIHGIKVGGPCYTEAIGSSDKNDFRVWKMIQKFMDMSLYHLDFFSFHPYNAFHSHGSSYNFTGTNEGRLVAIIDLIESYAHHKRGVTVPLLVTEYGLGKLDVDSHTPIAVSQWAYAFLHNSYMFTFLNHRGAVDNAAAFLLSHDTHGFEVSSIFTKHGEETFVAKAYRFWNHFYNNQQFLRVESQYNGAERHISPLAVVDPHNKKVTVLLHNHYKSAVTVKFNFNQRWITPADAKATCIHLESGRNPELTENQHTHLTDSKVTVLGETTCFYTFQTGHNFAGTPTVEESTHYSTGQVYHIQNNGVQATVNLPKGGHIHSANLRIGVSNSNKNAQVLPRSVQINGHHITDHYSLYDANRGVSETLWEVYNYRVPTGVLKDGANSIRLEFHQSSGYVSTIALVVGEIKGHTSVVG